MKISDIDGISTIEGVIYRITMNRITFGDDELDALADRISKQGHHSHLVRLAWAAKVSKADNRDLLAIACARQLIRASIEIPNKQMEASVNDCLREIQSYFPKLLTDEAMTKIFEEELSGVKL